MSWLAAALDGEGSIVVCRIKTNGNTAYTLELSLANTVLMFCERAEEFSDVGRINRQGLLWRWRCTRQNELVELLPRIIPYLQMKKEKAEVLYYIAKLRLGKKYLPPKERPWTDVEKQIAEMLVSNPRRPVKSKLRRRDLTSH